MVGGPTAADEFASPSDVWRGYDPAALALVVEPLARWQEEGAIFEKLRFTAEESGGARVRVFAMQGAPADGGGRPGILHIHGGGQTASLDWVRYWVRRGYVAATFDFCGPWADRTEVTDWGPLKQANMKQAAGGYQVDPTPRASSWYHWTLAARRALTLLANHPQVDAERLGIFGISVGGTLCWMVAGSDARVKAAAPIYGCGYEFDRRKMQWGFAEPTPASALFQRTMSAEAHAPSIACPILFLNASNDFHGWLDFGYDALASTKVPHWQTITPRHNHHIDADQAAALPVWMDAQLRHGDPFPDSPSIELALDGQGIPKATVRAPGSAEAPVDFYYALGKKPPPDRYWRLATANKEQPRVASLPFAEANEDLYVFANVYYPGGFALSTDLGFARPSQLGPARATLDLGVPLDPRTVAESWFYMTAHTDPNVSRRYLVVVDVAGEPVVQLESRSFGDPLIVNVGTHIVGDPQFTGADDRALAFDWQGAASEEGLSVTVSEHDWTPLAKSYMAHISQTSETSGWRTVVLPRARLQSADANSPSTWQHIDRIQLQGRFSRSEPLQLRRLRWVAN